MLKNYILVAWRNLWKSKAFSLINILGLSVGIAFTMLIGAYVWGELQVNHQLKNNDNQYIILSKWKDPNLGDEINGIAELPKALATNYPGLVSNYYHTDLATTDVSKGDKHYRESIQIGDSTLLHMYGFKVLQGDEKTALNDPFSVVITEHAALKYFGRTDVVGQSINFESMQGDHHDFMISAVLEAIPQNSVTDLNGYNRHVYANSEFFFNAESTNFFKRYLNGWDNTNTVDYIKLRKGADPNAVNKAMAALISKYETDDVIRNSLTPYLVALNTYHLVSRGGIIEKMTWTLSCIALFILLMAVINFVNICIGRASGRMKEMGIRKVMGGLRKQLIWQFLAESTLMVTIATVFALLIYLIARPYFSDLLDQDITGLFSFPLYFIPIPFVFALLVGLLAGIYPALVLSALKAVDSLKGKLSSVKESVLLRKTLVAFQFGTAAVVFIGAVVVSQQINLFFNGDLGYNKDRIMYAQLPRDWSATGVAKMEAIRRQIGQMPQVNSIALSFEIPDGGNGGNYLAYKQGEPANPLSVMGVATDDQYLSVYDISLKAGRFFNPVYKDADSSQIVINQTEAATFGWKNAADAIGQKIIVPAYSETAPFTVCGVTADFHFGSMRNKIQAMTFMNVNHSHAYRFFSIKLKPGDLPGSITALQSKWAQLMPGAPFEYHFMDDALANVYSTELQLKQAAFVATILSIIIVLLGVLGLISLSIQKRTREIGIRKVLGSSVAGITSLFLKDFLGVVLIAGVVACPLAYLIMNSWLNDYAYRISISFSPFVWSILLLTVATTVLIVLQTMRAAFANPVKSLRNE